jgi:hypothetical protein
MASYLDKVRFCIREFFLGILISWDLNSYGYIQMKGRLRRNRVVSFSILNQESYKIFIKNE